MRNLALRMGFAVVVVTTLCCHAFLAAAQGVLSPQAVILGVSGQTTALTVTQVSDGAEGKLESEPQAAPFAAILFAPSKVGGRFFLGTALSAFTLDMKRQAVAGEAEPVDVGTSARGSGAALTFEFSYLTADSFTDNFFQVGAGFGLGYLTVAGTVVLDDADGTTRSFDVSGLSSGAISVFARGRLGPLFLSLSSAGPSRETDEVDLAARRVSLDLGWVF